MREYIGKDKGVSREIESGWKIERERERERESQREREIDR